MVHITFASLAVIGAVRLIIIKMTAQAARPDVAVTKSSFNIFLTFLDLDWFFLDYSTPFSMTDFTMGRMFIVWLFSIACTSSG